MNKFIIIDHSLANLQGHHYECSVSVAEAAARLGYEPIIVANRSFSQELHPANIKIIPAFEMDWLGNEIQSQDVPTWQHYLQLSAEFLKNDPLQNFQERINSFIKFKFIYLSVTQPQLQIFLEKVVGSLSRLRGWTEEDIENLRSLPFANTFWGLFKIIWGSVRLILKILATILNKIFQKLFTFKPSSFRETLSQVLQQIKVTSKDHILIHTLSIEQVEELFYFLESSDRTYLPHYHILLRRDIEDPLVLEAKGMGLKACLNRFYESELWSKFVMFYTDTEDLVQRHNTLSSIQFIQLAIPFRQEKLREFSEKRDPNKPIHLVYLGDARPEKGYHYLPDLVEKLWEDYIHNRKVKFTIQSNFNIAGGELGILEARLKLEQYPSSQISLIKNPMTADDYYQLLVDADIVILPYDSKSYQVRTSGVLTESLAAGKPVVVPANTWLSKQVDSSRAGIYEHPDEIASAVIKILEDFEQFSEAAYQYRLSWQEKNSPDALVKCLIQEKTFTSLDNEVKSEFLQQEKKIPKILFICEGDALLEKSQTGLLSWQHLNYLSRCGYQVYGLFFPKNKVYTDEQFDSFFAQVKEVIQTLPLIQTWILKPNSSTSICSGINCQKYIRDLQENKTSLIRDLVECSHFDIPDSLIKFLQVKKIDVVFLNSVIGYHLIEKLALEKTPLICEMPQLYSHYYALSNHRYLDEEEFELECQLLGKCTVILAHNSHEGEKIRELIHGSLIYSLQNYHEIMNKALTSILGDNVLNIDEFNRQKKVAVLYPWGDILERKSGASQRSSLLIDYLKNHNYLIWVLTVGEEKNFWQDNIHYSYYEQDFSNFPLVKQVYYDAYKSWSASLDLDLSLSQQRNFIENEDIYENWLPWIYYQFRFDTAFINWIEKVTDWADVVILEYPFWATIVGSICQRKNIKLLITAHDILAKQLKENSLIGKIALAEEINGLKQADYVIAVSEADQVFFSQYGLKVQCIPHAINLAQIDQVPSEQAISLNEQHRVLAKESFCLFVGSKHPPNIKAVAFIRHLAESYSQSSTKISVDFVVVGNCCEPEEADNFKALGKVDNQTLIQLYQQATLFISPLLSGTGMSVKIIEAMAYGKVILGTSVAFRGYPVESGVNCIICDDLTEYTRIIFDLSKQPEKIKEIGKKAREFAEAYDYLRLYRLYKELIEAEPRVLK